ncbi:reprolysin-like metallopeptidase [Flavobacterium filum]|uniref:reprolysin-like metallopeptidase n=1 Tax=Flavobacterium filum TaxID=370974 RepID=UPI0004794F96|nr:M12 family metallo-peptidase [Flavobacterium filum]
MKLKLLCVSLLASISFSVAQSTSPWTKVSTFSSGVLESRLDLPQQNLFNLNVEAVKQSLNTVPNRFSSQKNGIVMEFPNETGKMERFSVFENSQMEAALAAQYPEIKSYIGIGIDNPTSTIYFSISPLGFKSMQLNAGKSAVFIEPISSDLTTYTVYRKADKVKHFSPFECGVIDTVNEQIDPSTLRPNADDSTLRTFRLALSCTGEYATYFGGTTALALAAMNNTMTRVNGVFEKDFAIRMVLVANNNLVIYTNASTDPYSPATSMSNWNNQLQTTLTNVIGEANYDVGHLFGATGGGGNAGCIGCVCVNNQKGRGYTSPANGVPSGDTFDIDYVAHEFGHQFGANHTFSMSNEGTGANMEPGSGSTIMGYAGITSQDIQPNSDAYFHAISIQQVTNNVKGKTCQTNTATGNAVPTANAGLDYTIPKSTPFMLTGSGTDANGDVLTFNWEQFDNAASTATGASSAASATRTTGPTFRSYNSSTSPVRYFPRMQSVLAGATTTAGTEITVEALPSVARTMNFRLTVRDNREGGSANNSDDMVVTVNATAGPFTVTSPNAAVSYAGGSSQTVTWNVAGTTANNVNCANVDILISTDGGNTWTTLLTATPNDGSQAVTMPNVSSSTCRIMVKGNNHIFFDVSNANFTLTTAVADTTAPTAPTNLTAAGTTQTSTNLSWTASTDNVGVTGYDVYRDGSLLASVTGTTYTATGLTASTTYSFFVRAKDAAGNVSGNSNTVSVTTQSAPAPDTTAPTAPTLSALGTTQTSTNLSWSGATDNVGVTGYDVYQNGTFLASTTATTYVATGLTASTAYTFNVRAKDAAGNISVNSNTVSVTTLANTTVTYCASRGNSTADEFINRVQLGSINNLSGNNGGYGNFTNLSTNLVRGTSNAITITPGWTGTVYSEAYRVWIDWNRDGDFADAGEQVFNRNRTTATPISGSFTVPTTALLGQTRMRVSMKYNASPTSCETFSFGEVEDYTVNVVSSGREGEVEIEPIVSSSIKLYPNPVKDGNLFISSETVYSQFRIINVMGQVVQTGTLSENTVNVSSLTTGTYLLELVNETSSETKRFIKQ